jgi:hypothetical protein
MGPKFKKEEIAKIDEVLKAHNMNKAEFIRWAVDKLENEGK